LGSNPLINDSASNFDWSAWCQLSADASLEIQLAVLGPSYLIDSFVEVFGDMKLVMDDLSLGRCRGSGAQIRLPHVDRDRFNLVTLLDPEPCRKLLAGLSGADRCHIKNPALCPDRSAS
jgi:hypothetical protein